MQRDGYVSSGDTGQAGSVADSPPGDLRQQTINGPTTESGGVDRNTVRQKNWLKRAAFNILRLLRDYPRASVAAILTAVSVVAGIILLPGHHAVPRQQALVTGIEVNTTPQVPSYLGFIARSERVGQVWAAFQIPANETVKWRIGIQTNTHDNLEWRNGTSRGYASLPNGGGVVGGQIVGPVDTYQDMQNGYWSFSDSNFGLSFITKNQPIPGIVSIFLRSTGPDQYLTTSGYNASTLLPGITEVPPSPSAPFLSEDIVDATTFWNITGGPRIQNGHWWDWLQNGTIPETSASGVDDLARQASDNRAFDAAVAFGVAAAAGAAFAVEGVGALTEDKKRRRKEPDRVAAGRSESGL